MAAIHTETVLIVSDPGGALRTARARPELGIARSLAVLDAWFVRRAWASTSCPTAPLPPVLSALAGAAGAGPTGSCGTPAIGSAPLISGLLPYVRSVPSRPMLR